jgi:hypothetical protein
MRGMTGQDQAVTARPEHAWEGDDGHDPGSIPAVQATKR